MCDAVVFTTSTGAEVVATTGAMVGVAVLVATGISLGTTGAAVAGGTGVVVGARVVVAVAMGSVETGTTVWLDAATLDGDPVVGCAVTRGATVGVSTAKGIGLAAVSSTRGRTGGIAEGAGVGGSTRF